MMKNIIIIILSLLLMLLLLFQYSYWSNNKEDTNGLKRDTVVVTKFDTITVTKPVPKYIYNKEIIRDTLYTKDSVRVQVEVPITAMVYSDSTYRAVVSGYRAKLDTIQVFPKNTYTTITNTINKQKRWNVGVQAGFGYGCFTKQPDVYVGFGISYRLF